MSKPALSPKLRKKLVVPGAVVLGLAALFAYFGLKKAPVDYYVLKPIDLDYTILANCTVDYPRPLDLAFLQEGIVRSVPVKEGDLVTKGSTLVQLDDFDAAKNLAISSDNLRSAELKLRNAREEVLPSLQEKLKEYELNLQQAERTRDRYAELLAAGGISRAEWEKSEKEYQRALSQFNQQKLELESFSQSGLLADLENQVSIGRAQVELAKRNLENARIVSPFDGTVLKVEVQPGQKVNPATSVVTVVERADWQLGLMVDQRELPFLKLGLPAIVIMDAYPDERIAGEVSFVCAEVDKEKNTCELRIVLKDERPFIKPGMAGRAEILAARYEQILALPARFVKKAPGGGFVWLWDGRRAAKRQASFKPVGERWALVEGLPVGAIVLDAEAGASAGKLRPGQEVRADGGQ
jgi:HlyD family secretion protein